MCNTCLYGHTVKDVLDGACEFCNKRNVLTPEQLDKLLGTNREQSTPFQLRMLCRAVIEAAKKFLEIHGNRPFVCKRKGKEGL